MKGGVWNVKIVLFVVIAIHQNGFHSRFPLFPFKNKAKQLGFAFGVKVTSNIVVYCVTTINHFLCCTPKGMHAKFENSLFSMNCGY